MNMPDIDSESEVSTLVGGLGAGSTGAEATNAQLAARLAATREGRFLCTLPHDPDLGHEHAFDYDLALPSVACRFCTKRMTLSDEERLKFAESHARARVLVAICRERSLDDARKLLAEWWIMCDAVPPDLASAMYEQFVRAGWTSDTAARRPMRQCQIYRAHYVGTEPLDGLSWTTSLEVAKRYARHLRGGRALFFGLPCGPTQITTARCDRFLARFSGRGEHEVIPDKARVVVSGCAKRRARSLTAG